MRFSQFIDYLSTYMNQSGLLMGTVPEAAYSITTASMEIRPAAYIYLGQSAFIIASLNIAKISLLGIGHKGSHFLLVFNSRAGFNTTTDINHIGAHLGHRIGHIVWPQPARQN